MANTSQDPQSEIPDNLRAILFARGAYEAEKIEQIKMAFDDGDKDRVWELVKELLYGGPGAI